MTREFYELLLSELRMAAYEPGSPERGTDASLREAVTVNENLMSLGYTLRPDDIARLSVSGSLHGFYDRIKALVPDVTAEPMYPGFPRQDICKPFCQHTVGVIQKLVAGDQRNTAVNQRGHITHPQYFCTFDIEIFCQQHNGNTDNVNCHNQADGKLQGVPYKGRHRARKEKADNSKWICIAGGVFGGKDRSQCVDAGHHHESKEEI